MNFKELKKWTKEHELGFYTVEKLKNYPEVLSAFEKELKENTGRVGCYVYHSHTRENENTPLKFDGMRIGYYIRSRNPFNWQFRRTYGNH